MTQQFTQAISITGLDKDGNVLIVATNHPIVDYKTGALYQQPLTAVMSQLGQLNISDKIVNAKIDHIQLEGDYDVYCPPEFMTDLGLRYALAACYKWVDPITGTKIFFEDGNVVVTGTVDILSLGASFQAFDPWKNKALAWQIMNDFAVSMYWDHNLRVTFSDPNRRSADQYTNDPDEIVRRMLRVAVANRSMRADWEWNGHIPLSMVIKKEEVVLKGADLPGGENHTAPDTGLAP